MFWWRHKQPIKNAKVPLWFILFFVLLIVVWGGLKIYDYVYWPSAKIKIGSSPELKMLLADSPSHAYRGLSNRKELGDYQGMLFLFSKKLTASFRQISFMRLFVPLQISSKSYPSCVGSI